MSIPAFSIDGVLPPYVGSFGPGQDGSLMTPYDATPTEVVSRFGFTERRQQILLGWLEHRKRLRRCGIVNGFQWIDGSFVEEKIPADIDVVTFSRRAAQVRGPDGVLRMMKANPDAFDRKTVKTDLFVDPFFIDLDGTKPGLVNLTRYFCGLFSHRRGDDLWKGMLKVDLNHQDDGAAHDWLARNAVINSVASNA